MRSEDLYNIRSGEMTSALCALERFLLGMAAKMAFEVLGSPERTLANGAFGLARSGRGLFHFAIMAGAFTFRRGVNFLRV